MKKIFTLALGMMAVASVSNAQNLGQKSDQESKSYIGAEFTGLKQTSNEQRGTGMCTDTTRWAWARSLQNNGGQVQATYYSTVLHKEVGVASSFGTYMNIPAGTSIDMSGFAFYGQSLRPDGASVTVNAVVYEAGSDSLPTGPALAMVSVSLDTSTVPFLAPLYKEAIFTSPITVTGPIVVAIEGSATAGDSVAIIRGYTGSGVADDFPVVVQADGLSNGDYVRLPGTTFGARLPHFYPFVSYEQTNDFSMSVTKLTNNNEVVDFIYTQPSVTDHVIWSISGYLGDTTSTWEFGSGTTAVKARSTSHTFADASMDYTIVLTDVIELWNGGICSMTESKMLEKADPNSIADIAAGKFVAYVSQGDIVVANGEGVAILYSINGTILKQVNITSSFQNISINDLIGGIYILKVGDNVTKLKL